VTWELPHRHAVLHAWMHHAVRLGEVPTYLGSDGREIWYAQDIPRPAYDAALEALTVASFECLAELGGHVPSLRDRGIRWRPECCGETWRAWDVLCARGVGDCEDLAAAHAAWLRHRGDRTAKAAWIVQGPTSAGTGNVWHAIVIDGAGNAIDISRELGMSHSVACDVSGPCRTHCYATRPPY